MEQIEQFDHANAKIIRVTAKPRKPIEIKVKGNRDPRGPDNSVMIWLNKEDQLRIRLWKANRCYQFKEVIETDGMIELVAV